MSNVSEQADRCLKCKVPMCSKSCPVHTPIPQVMTAFMEGKISEAGDMLFNNNPMSAICSIICPHEKNCFGHCILGKKGLPVSFFEVEQYISGLYLDRYRPQQIEKNGKKLAVVGAGPAGITMSIIMAMRGYSVTLYDKKDEIGGILRYGIPEFRLPNYIVDKYTRILDSLGVVFRPNTPVGQSITADDMLLDGFSAVFISTGTSRPNKLGLLGESLGHVSYAIDYLKNPRRFSLGQKVAVIGAGNVAMDAARAAIRYSASDVTIIHHMEEQDVTASRDETEMAKLDGAVFRHCCSALRITESEVVCASTEISVDENGRRSCSENYDKLVHIPADSVIIALGQGPQAEYIKNMATIDTTARGLIAVDDEGHTSNPAVFAAGDIVTGPKTVVEAVALTKKIADAIDAYCGSK